MKNTTIVTAIVTVLVVVLLIVVVGGRSNNDSSNPTPTISASGVATPSQSPIVKKPAGSIKSPTPIGVFSYNDALKKYEDTRIQFGQYCNATPNRIVIKSGASIMLDNRSGDARTIALDATKYTLAGYGFRIVALTATTTPKTVVIDCGTAQNVGQIIIQK